MARIVDVQQSYLSSSRPSRRVVLRGAIQAAAGLAGVALLAACGNTTPPGVAPAALATTAPATGAAAPAAAVATKPAGAATVGGAPTTAAVAATTAPAPTTAPAAAGGAATPIPTPVPLLEAGKGRKTVLDVWYPFGGVGVEQQGKIFEEFTKTQPDIGIKGVYAANDLSSNQKLFTAIAGGQAPDVTWVDGPQVAEWGARGALEPLDKYYKADGLTEADFFAPVWKENQYQGKMYAMVSSADANFGFFWNKAVFREVGLDPEKPPTTIDQMDAYNEKIVKIDNNNIVRMGTIPWTVYGASNSLFTWGWAFGGEFFDAASNKITANDPKVVKTLEWMVGYAKKYDPKRISGFTQGFGTAENSPFYVGKTAMNPWGPWELGSIKRFAPKLEYGITFLPQGPDNAPPHSSWVGGWCIGIPQGSKKPEDGWKFMKWYGADPEGTKIVSVIKNNFPGYVKSKYFPDVAEKDPELKTFYEIIKETKHQRPVMPAQAYYTGALQRAVDSAIYGEKPAKQALDDATKETQTELDKILAKK